jgi:hypothetical protein
MARLVRCKTRQNDEIIKQSQDAGGEQNSAEDAIITPKFGKSHRRKKQA